MILKKNALLILSLFLVFACAWEGLNDGEQIGTATGAVIGGGIGAKMSTGDGKILGAGRGAIFGSWLGKTTGRSLDQMDQQWANDAAQETLETADAGQTNTWSNPDSGNSGTYTPTTERLPQNGQECRDFESTVIIDGQEEQATGRACRQEDGTWKIVK